MKSKHYDVVIIGGGAAGMYLATQLPANISVLIAESNDRIGKKLLATGNGKCNLTNLDLNIAHYNHPSYAENVLERFGAHDTIASFDRMGLITKVIDNRVYPYSECAASVLDVLRRALERRGTQISVSTTVMAIDKDADAFTVTAVKKEKDRANAQLTLKADNVVLASGSTATFGRDSLALFTAMGHTSKPFTPSLTPIRTDKNSVKGLQGVRVKAGLKIGYRYEVGEVLFKEFGLSGIASFNLATEIARGKAKAGSTVILDFMPDYSLAEAESILRRRGGVTIKELLTGIFHSRVAERIAEASGCTLDDKATDKANAIARTIKAYKLTVEGLGDASLAQVMNGGLLMDEFDNDLMSLKVPGAYAVGEALDIDGDSGGYNLQWAWSSAKTVSDAIAKKYR